MGVCLFVTLYLFAGQRNLATGKSGTIALLRRIFRGLLFTGWRSQRSFRRSAKKRGMEKGLSCLGLLRSWAVLALIILVWTIEFDFVGRFAALKMLGGLALLAYLFLSLQGSCLRETLGEPWSWLRLSEGSKFAITSGRRRQMSFLGGFGGDVQWTRNPCFGLRFRGVELLLLEEEQESEVPVMPCLLPGCGSWELRPSWKPFAKGFLRRKSTPLG